MKEDGELEESLEKLVADCEVALNVFLKYNLTGKEHGLTDIEKLLMKIKERDVEIIQMMCEGLKENEGE